jgi:hypothetical protein
MAGTASVYRIDTTGETESDARTANQIIEFNTGATNPDALSFLESFNDHWIEDISEHPNPKKALNKLQDALLGKRELVLRGWFEDPDNAGGTVRISTWMKDAKTNASLPAGRFGIRIDDLSNLDIAPSATVAWILYDATVEVLPDHPFEANVHS